MTAAVEARAQRHRAVTDARRESILAAARSAFFELGLEGASLREIAKRAAYTPGAIYGYFASKEEVYAALLGESLERLNAAVQAAAPAAPAGAGAAGALRARTGAIFGFYRDNPRDLDLGLHLFHGMPPRGLSPELHDALDVRLRDALAPCRRALQALGFAPGDAQAEVTALFAQVVGLLLLGHTGRIRMFRQPSAGLFERYLDALVARAPAAPRRRR